MNIHQKINAKANIFNTLEIHQAMQCIKRNRICLVPYYKERLIMQGRHVKICENFKSVYGKYRWELENNI
jgi:hypothetical protein